MYWVKERQEIILKWLVYVLVVIYIINCFTPLRLHVDTLRYFAILDCLQLGCPPESVAAKDYLPYGYTALLVGLSTLGILKSFTIVLINCVFLFASLYILVKIFRIDQYVWLFLVFVLLNWTTIKFVLHPLSEMQYLFFSVCSLYFFNEFTHTKKFILWEYRLQLITLIKKSRWVIVSSLLAVILVASFSKQLGLLHYVDVLAKQFSEGVGYKDILRWHFIELSEISMNLPFTKVVDFMPTTIRIIFLVVGIATLLIMTSFIFLEKKKTPMVIISYLIFYSVLMFNWPFYDPRFWVPILPFCTAILVKTSFTFPRYLKATMYTTGLVYAILGLSSVVYYSYTSFNKKVFATTQASGSYKNEYETFFYGKPQSLNNTPVDTVVVKLLERCN
jgi:hypothetical protein